MSRDSVTGRTAPLLTLAALTCVLLFPAHARATEIYKWVDEHGHVQFGDKPPAKGAEKVDVETHTPAPDATLDRQREQRDKLLDVYEEERTEHEEAAATAREQKQKQDANCSNAREQLRQMRSAQFLYRKTDDPRNPRVLNDQERAAETANMERQVAKWCSQARAR